MKGNNVKAWARELGVAAGVLAALLVIILVGAVIAGFVAVIFFGHGFFLAIV